MARFNRPTSVTRINDSFAKHVARDSPNPGVDYDCPVGTPVRALANGKVVAVGTSTRVGKWIAIDYDNDWGSDFLHLSRVDVSAGKRVTPATVVGKSGKTGKVATGPHLHVSLRNRRGAHLLNRGNVDLERHLGGTSRAGLAFTSLIEGISIMGSTVPVKYKEKGDTKFARFRDTPTGGTIDHTSKPGTAQRWKREIGFSGDAISAGAKEYLVSWAERIVAAETELKNLLRDTVTPVLTDDVVLNQRLDDLGIDLPTVEDIPDDANAKIEATSEEIVSAIAMVPDDTLERFGLERKP